MVTGLGEASISDEKKVSSTPKSVSKSSSVVVSGLIGKVVDDVVILGVVKLLGSKRASVVVSGLVVVGLLGVSLVKVVVGLVVVIVVVVVGLVEVVVGLVGVVVGLVVVLVTVVVGLVVVVELTEVVVGLVEVVVGLVEVVVGLLEASLVLDSTIMEVFKVVSLGLKKASVLFST